MKDKLILAILQLPIVFAEPERNLAAAKEAMEAALCKSPRPDILLLPELWLTGFFPSSIEQYAEDAVHAKEMMQTFAKMHGIYLVGGSLPIREKGAIYNRTFVFDRSGEEIAHYDKMHLFSPGGEKGVFTAGSSLATFSIEGHTAALAICYDLRFPELFRTLSACGAELVFLPAEWPLRRIDHFELLVRARAVENQIFFAACNGSGLFPKAIPIGGHSAVIDPWGEVLIGAKEAPAILTAALDFERLAEARKRITVWQDRRTDVYSSM